MLYALSIQILKGPMCLVKVYVLYHVAIEHSLSTEIYSPPQEVVTAIVEWSTVQESKGSNKE